MKTLIAIIFAIALFTISASAQVAQDQQAYCSYLAEQAKAEAIQLRSPSFSIGFTKSPLGVPLPEVYFGLQDGIVSIRKAKATIALAQSNCTAYKANENALLRIQSAAPSLLKAALKNRLTLDVQAEIALDSLIVDAQKRVEAQDLTRPSLYALQSAREKLEADKAATTLTLAGIYIPEGLPDIPLQKLVAESQANNEQMERAMAHLQQTGDWDTTLEGGGHQALGSGAGGPGPYGSLVYSHNFGSRAEKKHLNKAIAAFTQWKLVQENDVVRESEVLKEQVEESIKAQTIVLQTLSAQQVLIEGNLKLVVDADTTNALIFKNQLLVDQLALQVEIQDTQFRLDQLEQFLKNNFPQ
jgi:hypothetical protein